MPVDPLSIGTYLYPSRLVHCRLAPLILRRSRESRIPYLRVRGIGNVPVFGLWLCSGYRLTSSKNSVPRFGMHRNVVEFVELDSLPSEG